MPDDRTPEPDTAEPPATPDRPGRQFGARHLVAVAVASAMIATSISAAFAWSPAFDDVPSTHPFESEIAWMEATGISTGYPGTGPVGRDYRPGDPVTRQAMAAFMQRLYDLDGQRRFDSSSTMSITGSASWVALPGASVSVEVPPGVTANLHASFSAESACTGAVVFAFCRVRLVVDPPGAIPPSVLGPDDDAVAFDSNDNGAAPTASWESRSIDRYDDYVGDPGTWTITAEYSVSEAGLSFSVDDWVLMVETDLEPTTFVGAG